MKERPILMSAPMVRAILDGSKTQTRRTVKPQPVVSPTGSPSWTAKPGKKYIPNGPRMCAGGCAVSVSDLISQYCPYGQPGDRLWVKETFVPFEHHPGFLYRADADTDGSVPYLDNGAGGFGGGVCHFKPQKWKPSIFCTRAASRITLEITEVRVERLQDISEEDAKAEGITEDFPEHECNSNCPYAEGYKWLWESINGPGSWDANPWVWVIEFQRLNTP